MAGKAQDKVPEVHFPGGRGDSRVTDMARPLLRILELSSLKCHSPYFKQIGHCFLYTTIII